MRHIKLLKFVTTDDDPYYRKIATDIIRKNTTFNKKPSAISEAAYKVLRDKPTNYHHLKELDINGDCVWEHAIPVNDLVSKIFVDNTKLELVLENTPICIITRDEDLNLTNSGYRQNRHNWVDNYLECKINLIYYSGKKSKSEKEFEKWYETIDENFPTLYNRFIITGNKQDKVKLSDYHKATQATAIIKQIPLRLLDKEIMACYNVEKKRYKDGFYIRGIQLKEE